VSGFAMVAAEPQPGHHVLVTTFFEELRQVVPDN
jgi:hypothetical protein